jgi:ribonucleoside-diphosphate reductase alpha chain
MREWTALVGSGTGERGIFNRQASRNQVLKNGRRDPDFEWGTNPCSEIILRGPRIDKSGNPITGTGGQFCNLSEVVVRATDSVKDLERKVRIATILGTIQCTYTYFPYLRKVWEKNTAEERLLGVSLTGIMDNKLMTLQNKGLPKTLEHLKNVAISTNAYWAERFGISASAAITCVKPSGTVSQLVDSASGIHARHSPYYIRTVRGDNTDPLTRLLKDQGIPNEPDVTKPKNTTVFSFPVKSPEGAVCTRDLTAIQQLEIWLIYQRHWAEHKPSITINVKRDEWLEVGAFVYKNFDEMSGVAFLPYDDHVYQQAVYTEVDEKESVYEDGVFKTHSYESLLKLMPKNIDWSKLSEYEKEDTTTGTQSMACTGDVCEMVDISA